MIHTQHFYVCFCDSECFPEGSYIFKYYLTYIWESVYSLTQQGYCSNNTNKLK